MARKPEEFRNNHGLKERCERLEAELVKAQRESANSAAIKDIIGALTQGIETAKPPVWAAAAPAAASCPGVPTLFLSDLHWGEVVYPAQINGVNTYNVVTAQKRLKYCAETAIQLLRILDPKMSYPGIVLPLGGDMISGNIHEELTATNELNSMPAVLDLYGHLIALIERMAGVFGQVFLPCVTGNHGRDTRKVWAKDRHHTSFDWLLYRFLAKHFDGDKRITFLIPDGSDAHFSIHSTRYNLTHGDQFRAGDSIIGPIGPIFRGNQKKRSRNQQIDLDYDVLLLGHWHTYIHTSQIIVNGSLKGYDEYAAQGNFGFEVPQQALWITHHRHGITFRMPVYCEAPTKGSKTEWVSK